jgi:hypothetical protein
MIDDKPVGVIELSCRDKGIYTDDDERLIELLAKYISVHLKSYNENQILLKLAREKDLDRLFKTVVEGVPTLVNGRGCSIFLRRRLSMRFPGETGASLTTSEEITSLPAVLVETSELRPAAIGKATYEADLKDGLTSAVLVKGIDLVIPGGKGARTLWLRKNYPDYIWKGKHHAQDERDRRWYVNRPFMAVPI